MEDLKQKICNYCRKEIEGTEYLVFNTNKGGYDSLCEKCADDIIFECEICNVPFYINNIKIFNEKEYCTDCFEAITIECEVCGDRIYKLDSYENKYCGECFHDIYTYCEQCGGAVHRDYAIYSEEGNPYCSQSCLEDSGDMLIDFYRDRNFSYRDEGNRVYGIELEFETENRHAYYIAEDIFYDYVKEIESIGTDGSLSDYGIEIRTQPLPKDMILKFIDDLYSKYSEYLYTTDRTGIHINVNKESFKNRITLYKMMLLIKLNRRDIMKMCNRFHDEYCEINDSVLNNVKISLITDAPRTEKYSAMNFHRDRIEFRLFGNTMNKNKVKFYVEFIDAIEDYVSNKSIKDMYSEETFYDFIKSLQKIFKKYEDVYNELNEIKENFLA